jgi:probable addiction module antidote protein
MAKTKTRRWDAADYLEMEKDIAAYLEAALEEGDAALFTAALGDVARAKGMTEIARKTGLGRESLYKALSPDGNERVRHDHQGRSIAGTNLRAAP